jgi:hypothetical protein
MPNVAASSTISDSGGSVNYRHGHCEQCQPVSVNQQRPCRRDGLRADWQSKRALATAFQIDALIAALARRRLLGGRFGQAIVTGAGIGIGDDIVNSISDRLRAPPAVD